MYSQSIPQLVEIAEASLRQGDVQRAEALYRQAAEQSGERAELWMRLGDLSRLRKRWADAVAAYRRALELVPDDAEARVSLGITLGESGQAEDAVSELRRAVELAPELPQAHHNLGVALLDCGQSDPAIASLREALRLRPDYVEAHYNLGSALVAAKRRDEGIAHFEEALRRKPDHAGALNNLGLALNATGKPQAALICFQQAARLEPQRPVAHNSLGLALVELGRFEEAIAAYERALQLDPGFADAHVNLGSAYKEQGRLEEAIAEYDLALRLNPESASTRWNRSLALLQAGDYAAGWQEYEWRWRRGSDRLRPMAQPLWDGSPLEGRRILIYMEQGLGDMIQFIRYAALVAERGGHVIVECPPNLRPVFVTCPGIDELVAEGDPLPEFDVQIPLMSLPRLFGTTLQTVPADVPYLRPDPRAVERSSCQLPGSQTLKVGLCWQGNPRHPWDRHRSIPLERLEPLAHIDGVELVSLQKGAGHEQLDRVAFPVTRISDETETEGPSFRDTAAIIGNLDLIISVDTAIAHLAGALGAPVWLLLSDVVDWRWLRARRDTPWYPTMRLFRQKRLGDWTPAINDVRTELMAELTRRTRCGCRIEVTPGELIDRLTIIALKHEHMRHADQRAQLERERTALTAERTALSACVTAETQDKLEELTAALQDTNRQLWEVEDTLRELESAGRFDDQFVQQARSVYHLNDQRSSLKQQINHLYGARFGELKQYPEY